MPCVSGDLKPLHPVWKVILSQQTGQDGEEGKSMLQPGFLGRTRCWDLLTDVWAHSPWPLVLAIPSLKWVGGQLCILDSRASSEGHKSDRPQSPVSGK